MSAQSEKSLANQHLTATSDQFLKRFALLWGVFATTLGVLYLFGMPMAQPYGTILLIVTAVASRVAMQQGRMRLARGLILIPVCLFVVMLPWWAALIRTPVLVSMPILIFMGGWFFGRKFAVVLAGIFIVFIGAYFFAETQGYSGDSLALRPAENWVVNHIIVCVAAAIVIWSLLGSLQAVQAHETELMRRLGEANADLSGQLSQTTLELKFTGETLSQIRQDYEKVYPSAMMAAVIPSLAHDLNTPLGNTRMAASSMRDHLSEFQAALGNGNLKRSELEKLLSTFGQGLDVVDSALAKSTRLVASLKQMSIDQASQRRRQFSLKELVDDVLITLSPSFKKSGVNIEFECTVSSALSLDSYPGPLGQILVNLIQNAVVHGFDGREAGKIRLLAEPFGLSQIRLQVIDDGQGMTPSVLEHLFESFFTTRRDRGGSGVGLAFSKRLAQDVLGGTLSALVSTGAGATFILELPKVAPVSN